MQRLFEHINAFSRLMRNKGYDGNFHSPFGFYDKLKDNLIKHVLQCYEEKKEIGPLNLTTYSHWTDSKGPYVRCDFHADFSEPGGFNVRKMDIQYGNEYGPIKNKEILLHQNSEIPGRDEANHMVMGKKRGIRI